MGQVVVLGLTLLIRPRQTWRAIRQGDDPPTLTLIGVYVAMFAALPLLGRALGHVLMDWTTGLLLLDAVLYSVLCLLLVFGLGLMLGAAVPVLQGTEDRAAALHLALYASTPLWLSGLLHVIPVAPLHTVFPFVGVGWTGWLLLSGTHEVLDVPVDRALLPLAVIFAVFTAGFVLLTQVLLTYGLSRA